MTLSPSNTQKRSCHSLWLTPPRLCSTASRAPAFCIRSIAAATKPIQHAASCGPTASRWRVSVLGCSISTATRFSSSGFARLCTVERGNRLITPRRSLRVSSVKYSSVPPLSTKNRRFGRGSIETLRPHLHSHPAPSSPGLASVLTLNFGSSALLSGPLQHIAPIVG